MVANAYELSGAPLCRGVQAKSAAGQARGQDRPRWDRPVVVLVGLGVPESRARASVQAFELGRTVVVVRAEGERLEEARNRLQAYGPYELELTEQQTAPTCE